MRNRLKKNEPQKTEAEKSAATLQRYEPALAGISAQAEVAGIDAAILYAFMFANEESQRTGQTVEDVMAQLLGSACLMLARLTPPPSQECAVNG